MPGRIWEFLCSVVSNVAQWASNLIDTAKTEIPNFISSVVEFISDLPDKFLEIGGNIVKGLWDGICAMGNWIKNKVKDFFGGIVDGVKGVLGIASPSKVFKGIGGFMAEGLGEGFETEMDSVSSQIKNAIPTEFDLNTSTNVSSSVKGSLSFPRRLSDYIWR